MRLVLQKAFHNPDMSEKKTKGSSLFIMNNYREVKSKSPDKACQDNQYMITSCDNTQIDVWRDLDQLRSVMMRMNITNPDR